MFGFMILRLFFEPIVQGPSQSLINKCIESLNTFIQFENIYVHFLIAHFEII